MAEDARGFRIQWKGRDLGAHSRQEIEKLLEAEEISLIHRVEVDGHWESVADFLGDGPRLKMSPREVLDDAGLDLHLPVLTKTQEDFFPRSRVSIRQMEQLVLAGYILCGTTFVLPVVATVPSLWLASRIWRAGAREPARLQFILCGLFTVLGMLFYLLLYHVRDQGWV